MRPLLTWFIVWHFLNPSGAYDLYEGAAFKQVGTQTLRADIYVPWNRTEPVPVVLFVHGGMWAFGKKTDNADLAGFLAENGVGAVLIDFRNSRSDGFAGQVADVKDAVRWLRAHADEYGLDPERIGLFGSSSGGHLAALAAYGEPEDFGADPPGTSSAIQACFFLYGIYDLAALAENGQVSYVVEWCAGADAAGRPELYDIYSPARHIDGTEPRTLIMHGEGDRVVPCSQAEEMVALLQEANVPVTYMPVADMGHGFARKQRWLRPWLASVMTDFFLDNLETKDQ